MKITRLVLSCLLLPFFNCLMAQNIIIDSTYGEQGIFYPAHNLSMVTIQSDGMLLGTRSLRFNNRKSGFRLGRYEENGQLDSNFGQDGETATILFDDWNADNPVDNESVFVRLLKDLTIGTLNFSLDNTTTLIYPNPIKNTATLEYTLENPETITIQLTDLHGRILKTYLHNKLQKAGAYQQAIDLPENLAKGMYFIQLLSPNGQLVVKVMK